MLESIDNIFGIFVGYLYYILFFKIGPFPIIILVLLFGAITFTIYFNFINIRSNLYSYY